METPIHSMADLFQQLGLDGEPAAIDAFVVKHRPLSDRVLLADAPFWNASQAALLREEKAKDGDWAVVVDALSSLLRA
ncbi:MAG: DUF2789 domain-containing protein [Microbacteriaceae bacterium]|nr:DUF2789 domain-containing protein [Burkholderiaceae bacterium]